MGGIPHDLYGMTTNSIHEFVLKSLAKLSLKEENVTKVMTGGPDGDLGSNEILISKDRILAMIDGSGVLHDPAGIDRRELTRLARERKMVEHFRRERLSKEGFFVGIKERNVILPDGPSQVRRRPLHPLRRPAVFDQHQQLAEIPGRQGQSPL
jgi:glutamate dehydrogenase